MHIITKLRIKEAGLKYPNAKPSLFGWYRIMRRGTFHSFQDLTSTFGANNIDHVGKYYIFDIAGNHLRLIAAIHFNTQKVYIRYILTHADYDKLDLRN